MSTQCDGCAGKRMQWAGCTVLNQIGHLPSKLHINNKFLKLRRAPERCESPKSASSVQHHFRSSRRSTGTMSTFVLVTGGYDTNIRIFDAVSQTHIRTIQFCDQQVLRLAFSGCGPVPETSPLFLVVAGSPSVAVYDVTTHHTSPNIFAIYQGHTEAVTAVGFEPSNTSFVYSASEDGTLQTWIPELAPGQFAYPGGHPMLAASQAFSIPSRMVNSGPDGVVAIHDAVYYPPLDLFFTVDYIGRLRIWEHRTSAIRSEHVPHSSKRNLQCIDLSSDYSTLVLANFDGLVFIYDVQKLLFSETVPLTFRANGSYIPRVRLSVSGNILICTTNSGAIKVFRMADVLARTGMAAVEVEYSVTPIREFSRNPGWIWDIAFVEDQETYFFTCSSNTQVICWNLNDLQQSNEVSGHPRAVVCLAVRERTPSKDGEEMIESVAVGQVEQVQHSNGDTVDQQQVQDDGQFGSPVTAASTQQGIDAGVEETAVAAR